MVGGVFGFPHVFFSAPTAPSPPSVFLPPPGPGPEEGVNQDLSLREPPPRLAPTETGAGPRARHLAGSPAPAGAGPGAVGWAGGRDAQGARERGRRAQSREGPSSIAPQQPPAPLLWMKEEPVPLHPPPPSTVTPFRGAALTSSARSVQAASRTSAKAGSIATLRGHRASCRARRIRRARALPVSPPPRRLRWPRALLPGCSLLYRCRGN